MAQTRRAFLTGLAGAAAASTFPAWPVATSAAPAAVGRAPRGARWPASASERAWLGLPDPARHRRGLSSIGAARAARSPEWRATAATQVTAPADPHPLAARFPDLRRRFVFEYYPWYDSDPWYHWNEAGRTPPLDVSASSMPRLGPYDSWDPRVIEQHARWMTEAGIGAINLSWWGRGDYTDLAVPRVMDVMRDHDIKVTFHLEPYRDDRAGRYAEDLVFLLREYGEKRRWDTFLLLEDGDGRVAPVFKSFRTILPSAVQDCLGRVFAVPDYTSDGDWRRQTDGVREEMRRDFSRLYLLADSLDVGRTGASGFDGLAVYDNFVTPPQWTRIAQDATDVGLLYSFNVNPGFDRYPDREPPPPPDVDPCYGGPLGFEPGGQHPDWAAMEARQAAQELALGRIRESFDTTTALQHQAGTTNQARGFFLAYVNSFNEWHEGSQLEPAKDYADLTPEERRYGYHNPPDGMARLRQLRALMDGLTTRQATARAAPPRL
jgi:hypothetical protein